MFTGQLVLCLLNQYYLSVKINWDEIAAKAQERKKKDEQLIEMKEETPLAKPATPSDP